MKIKIAEVRDKKIWEEFITSYSPQSLFQSWNWGETQKNIKYQPFNFARYRIVPGFAQGKKSKIKNKIWRLGIYGGEELVGIAQVVKVTAKRGTFLHVRHGPIFSRLNKEYFSFLLDYLKRLGRGERVSFIRVSPLIENSPENKMFFKSLGFHDAPIPAMDGELCWVLDLSPSEEDLLANMRKTTRYLIRQAYRLGVEIIKTKDKKDIENFLSLYISTAKRHHFVPHKGIEEEFEEFVKDDQILLFRGYYQKKLLAGALILFYNHQAIYHHSASIEQKIPVNYLLQWEAIKEAKARGKKRYNFWGIASSGNKRHPWCGHSLFKKGFGGREVEYLHAKDYPLSYLYCTTYLIESARRIWKGY